MEDFKNSIKIYNLNREELLEILRLIELIEKKEIIDIIINYRNNKEKYSKIEIEIIEKKIEQIKSIKAKYIKKEKIKNITIYSYEKLTKIYWNTKANLDEILEELNKYNKEIYIKNGEKIKKIKKEDIKDLMKEINNIIIK